MSDTPTPRTDACQGSDGTIRERDELSQLARQLERELSVVKAERDDYQTCLADIQEQTLERWTAGVCADVLAKHKAPTACPLNAHTCDARCASKDSNLNCKETPK